MPTITKITTYKCREKEYDEQDLWAQSLVELDDGTHLNCRLYKKGVEFPSTQTADNLTDSERITIGRAVREDFDAI